MYVDILSLHTNNFAMLQYENIFIIWTNILINWPHPTNVDTMECIFYKSFLWYTFIDLLVMQQWP